MMLILLLWGNLFDPKAMDVVDLTHPLGPNIPTFSGKPQFQAREMGGPSYSVRDIEVNEHTGTHVDAPAHFVKGKATTDLIAVTSLVAPAVVVDVMDKVKGNPDYQVSVADLEAWEKKHGRIPYGALVIAATGWSIHWPNPKAYRAEDARGVLHFPGFSEEAVDWLITNRPRVAGLGIDTLSVDYGPSTQFEVHKKSHAAGFYHVENIDRPERLPAKGAVVFVGVLPLVGGSGSPARIIAVVPAGTLKK